MRLNFWKIAATVFSVFSAIALTACQSSRKAGESSVKSRGIVEIVLTELRLFNEMNAPEDLRRAVRYINAQKYEEALKLIDEFVKREPASPYTQSAQLNAGRALEGLGRWNEAIERYRGVVAMTEGVAPKLQAMALYRMSFCYEALGEDQSVVATLIDVSNRSAYLPEEVATAEVPARIAAAYARSGNFDTALKYYNIAERGLLRLKRLAAEEKGRVPDWLARTLYYMGTMSFRRVHWDDFESALRPLAYGQVYLLEAAELGVDPWSDLAAKDLMSLYGDLWRVIENVPVPSGAEDPVVAHRGVQTQQWARCGLLVEHMQELRARVAPRASGANATQSLQVRELLDFLSDLDGKIGQLLAQRPAGEGLTPESLERFSRVRGHVIAPDPSLERLYLESVRKSRHKLPLRDSQDPNL